MRDLVAAEWIKLWSLRSTYWLLGLTAVAIVALNANAALQDVNHLETLPPDALADFKILGLRDAFGPNASLVLMLVAGSIGASVIVSEHSSGLIRTTFVAVPARRAVMAAKVAVVAPVLLGFGALVAGASFAVSQAILADEGIGLSISDPDALQAVAASALLAPASALVGMALGAVIRQTAAAMVTTPMVLIAVPTFVNETYHWSATLKHAMLAPAWQHLTEAGARPWAIRYDPTVTGSWLVMATWSLVATAVAITAVQRRDV